MRNDRESARRAYLRGFVHGASVLHVLLSAGNGDPLLAMDLVRRYRAELERDGQLVDELLADGSKLAFVLDRIHRRAVGGREEGT